jgi:NADH:ubiquinone oxidoreductase subunit 3 (subunit A)
MKIINFVKKYWRAILFVLFEISMLVLAIGGIGWTDYAETKFWQVAWIVLAILGVIAFIAGMKWLDNQRNTDL